MTQQGATLQNYNSELVSCIEEARTRRAAPRRAPTRARLDLIFEPARWRALVVWSAAAREEGGAEQVDRAGRGGEG